MSPIIFLLCCLGSGITTQVIGNIFPLNKNAVKADHLWDVTGYIAAFIFIFFVDEAADMVRPILASSAAFLGGWHQTLLSLPTIALVAIYLLVFDHIGYWTHRLMHTNAFWNIHAWHHSPTKISWVSGSRASPLHLLVNIAPQVVVAATLFPVPDGHVAMLVITIISIFNTDFIHANIKLPFQRQIEWIFVTPRYHLVHHSANMVYTNNNYGFMFTFWDKLFLTYTNPDHVSIDEPKGLDYEYSKVRALFGLPARLRAGSQSSDESVAARGLTGRQVASAASHNGAVSMKPRADSTAAVVVSASRVS